MKQLQHTSQNCWFHKWQWKLSKREEQNFKTLRLSGSARAIFFATKSLRKIIDQPADSIFEQRGTEVDQ